MMCFLEIKGSVSSPSFSSDCVPAVLLVQGLCPCLLHCMHHLHSTALERKHTAAPEMPILSDLTHPEVSRRFLLTVGTATSEILPVVCTQFLGEVLVWQSYTCVCVYVN